MSFLRSRARTLSLLAACLLLGGCALPGTIAQVGSLPQVPARTIPAPLPPVRFPQDEAPHRDLTEWWYYTGHLTGQDALGVTHRCGFELTVFQTLRGSLGPYYAAHFAVSDLSRAQFHYDERAQQGTPTDLPSLGSASGFKLAVGDWSAQGLNGSDHLTASMRDYGIALALRSLKPLVLHGGSGLLSEGVSGYSYYYSRTRMAITGTLLDHGATVRVTGLAWMDHQWGNFLPLAGGGWDWFSLQLDDNREVMLYVLRDSQHRPVGTFGTYVAADGTYAEIAPQTISARAIFSWTSPVTGGAYPSGWEVTLGSPDLHVRLTPLLLDQELVTAQSTGTAYWEGAVAIGGSEQGKPVAGEGYVELTGYAQVPGGTPKPGGL
jgi:predicted secreted hydrolase